MQEIKIKKWKIYWIRVFLSLLLKWDKLSQCKYIDMQVFYVGEYYVCFLMKELLVIKPAGEFVLYSMLAFTW